MNEQFLPAAVKTRGNRLTDSDTFSHTGVRGVLPDIFPGPSARAAAKGLPGVRVGAGQRPAWGRREGGRRRVERCESRSDSRGFLVLYRVRRQRCRANDVRAPPPRHPHHPKIYPSILLSALQGVSLRHQEVFYFGIVVFSW